MMMQLLQADIFHQRVRPKANTFGYRALYCLLPLRELENPQRHGLMGVGRPGLFSLWARDFGEDGMTPRQHIRRILDAWNVHEADGEITLMALPRVLGYGFNPVSFWLCNDGHGNLRAALAEVNNTFGERHTYLCCHDDHRPIAPGDVLEARKKFHVSPFLKVQGRYFFRFSRAAGRIAIAIDLEDGEGLLLRTSVAGRPENLSSRRLLRALFANPLYPLKVIGLIHYQAVKLFLKGLPHFRKPPPPETEVSRG